MKTERNLVKNLARTADILNTINGGMSQVTLNVSVLEKEWLIKMKIPGVELENLHLEVMNNHLYVHHMMEIESGEPERAPYMLAMIPLVKQIDVEAITAAYENGWTLINLPFDEIVDSYDREIKIIRK